MLLYIEAKTLYTFIQWPPLRRNLTLLATHSPADVLMRKKVKIKNLLRDRSLFTRAISAPQILCFSRGTDSVRDRGTSEYNYPLIFCLEEPWPFTIHSCLVAAFQGASTSNAMEYRFKAILKSSFYLLLFLLLAPLAPLQRLRELNIALAAGWKALG